MIYLLDSGLHSKTSLEIINSIVKTDVEYIEMAMPSTYNAIYCLVSNLINQVQSVDIVLCPWCISANEKLDELFEKLSKLCTVICAAGNHGKEVEFFSPARAFGVTVIGSANKEGNRAQFSNFSYIKQIILMPGTNVELNDEFHFGTSISSAIYASLLEKCRIEQLELELEIDKYINSHLGRL